MICNQEGPHIWFIDDNPQYADGWYFSDECSQFNGPYKTKEEAEKALADYSDELTNGDG
jgi:hypothetical protein